MTREFRERGLIVDEDVAHYDGTTAVVRSEHVPASDIEFMRWRSERWMKMRHLPAGLLSRAFGWAVVVAASLVFFAATTANSSAANARRRETPRERNRQRCPRRARTRTRVNDDAAGAFCLRSKFREDRRALHRALQTSPR